MGGFEYRAAGELLRSVAAGLRVGESQAKIRHDDASVRYLAAEQRAHAQRCQADE